MPVKLKTYQAYSMAEALAAVKRDLGGDAVILRTRSFRRGGFLGLGRRMVFEVTATASAETPAGGKTVAKSPAHRAVRAYRQASGAAAGEGDDAGAPSQIDRLKTRRLAQAMLERHEREAAVAGAAPPIPPASDPPAPGTETAGEPSAVASPEAPSGAAPVARRFLLQEPAPPARPPSIAAPRRPLAATPSLEARRMQDELSAIRSMVSEVLARQQTPGSRAAGPPDLPGALFEMYLALVGQDVSEELADRIVTTVRDELDEDQRDDPETVREATLRHLAAFIPTAGEMQATRSSDGRPLTIAMVGPTGVGKTTTLAKIAASFKLRHGCRVGLITADTYRIAAVEQLRTYGNIIGLPLRVVLTPAEMRQAIHALRDCDVILIDTAGRSQNDTKRIEELRAFLAAAQPHEIHLVLSSTAGEKVLLREAQAFGVVGVDKIVLTKLDEAVSFGVLVNVMQQVGKSLSFVTTGQEVPDHIEVGRSDRLARLILGAPDVEKIA